MEVDDSTISGNSAHYGGGIVTNSAAAKVFINNSTVSLNSADAGGGMASNSGTYYLKNSIIAGNTTPNGYDANCHVGVTSLGYNITQGDCASAATGDIVVADPMLGNLEGSPPYLPISPTNPAVDAGDPAGCADHLGNPLLTDQRGFARVGRCDIGAVELQPIEASSKTANKSNAYFGESLRYLIVIANSTSFPIDNVIVTDTLPSSLNYHTWYFFL